MKFTPQVLSKAISLSWRRFSRVRGYRVQFMLATAGRFFAREDAALLADRAAPVNLLHQFASTLVPNLVFQDPQCAVNANVLAYRDYAAMLGLAVSMTARRGRLRDELRRAVMDSMVGAGFLKTGLADSGHVVAVDSVDIPVGRPFCEHVSAANMVLDPAATSWDAQQFIGDRIVADRDWLLELPGVNKDLVRRLPSIGTTGDKPRTDDVMAGTVGLDEVCDLVEVVELFIPRDRRVVVLPFSLDSAPDKFIAERDWNGPPGGTPYHMLGYMYIGESLYPIAPIGILYDMHQLVNHIARKIARQAQKNKKVLVFQRDAESDVARLSRSGDGETVGVDDLEKMREIELSAASDAGYTFVSWARGLFSELAMNVDLLSGAGTGEDTATQAEIVQANATVRLADMERAVYDLTGKVMRDLAYYLHTDDLIDLPLIDRQRGRDVQLRLTPDARQGDFLDYTFNVVPFSMARQDPNKRLRRLLQAAQHVIPSAVQAAQLMGPAFKVDVYIADCFRELGIETADAYIDGEVFVNWVLAQTILRIGGGKADATVPPPVAVNPGQPLPTALGPLAPPPDPLAQNAQAAAAEIQAFADRPAPSPGVAAILPPAARPGGGLL